MVAPVTGPFNRTDYLNGPPTGAGFKPRWFEAYREWYRQKPPYNLPLAYKSYTRRVLSYSYRGRDGNGNAGYTSSDDLPTEYSADNNLYNRCYSKLKEAVGDHASVGIALAEAHQSMEMINTRLVQMFRFTRALARGRFGEAAGHLGVPLRRNMLDRFSRAKLRNQSKWFANTYLEFHFGWDPLLQDIHDAAEALSSPFLPHQASARVKATLPTSITSTYTNSGGIEGRHYSETRVTQCIRMECGVQVLNPNLALAQQLGLINPATIVWEKIPFSFVADWFVNVGDFLASFTDFSGLWLTNPQRTIFTRYARADSSYTTYQPDSFYNYVTSSSESFSKSSVMMERILGSFPGPELTVRRLRSPSVTRGLTATSLLLQQLRNPPRR